MKLLIAITFLAVPFLASADGEAPQKPDLIVKTGTGQESVYDQMFKELTAVCQTPVLQASPSKGSLQSLDELMHNNANLAYVQGDVLKGRKDIEGDTEVDNVRVFMPLFYSELHMIALSKSALSKFSDLTDKKIGTYGGAYITSRILLSKAGIRQASITQYETESDLLKGIDSGNVDVGMAVTGQPAGWVKKLTPDKYKFLDFDRNDVIGKVGSVYTNSVLRYPNLRSTTVPTVGVQVDMITYNYSSKKMVQNLSALKQCILDNLDELRETTGNHPKWRSVNPNGTSDWPMFKADATVGPSKPSKK